MPTVNSITFKTTEHTQKAPFESSWLDYTGQWITCKTALSSCKMAEQQMNQGKILYTL